VAAKRLALGALTQTEARFHLSRNELTAYVGMEDVSTKARPLKLGPGDKILLCSDGLWSAVDDEEMAQVLREKGPYLGAALIGLLSRANAASGRTT